MPSNTTYRPFRASEFEYTKLNFNAQGVSASPTLGGTTNIDYLIADDHLVTGAWMIINNGFLGDYVNLHVLDTSGGTYSGTPYAVLSQFITNWYVPKVSDSQFDMIYPAKIFTGMSLRVVYVSAASGSDPQTFAAINWKLHKVLV